MTAQINVKVASATHEKGRSYELPQEAQVAIEKKAQVINPIA